MFFPLRLRLAGIALIAIGRLAGEDGTRDPASLAAAEEALREAHRESGGEESLWAWIEALARVAWAETEAGRHGQAAERYRAALAAMPDDARTKEPEFAAMVHDGLGRALQNLGKFDEAGIHLTSALEIRAKQPGGETRLGVSEGHLGLLELVRGRYREAERLFHAALRHTPEDRHDLLAHRHDCLGRLHLALRAHGMAAEHFERAIRHAGEFAKDGDELLLDLRANLALCRFRGGEAEEALSETEALLAGDHPPSRRASLLNLAATIHASTGNAETAAKSIDEAVALLSEEAGAEHPSLAPMLANLGAIRLQSGDAKGALEPLLRARAIFRANVSEHHQSLVEVLYQIAACRLAIDDDGARQSVTEARAAAGELLDALVAGGSERELLTFRQQVDLHSIVCRTGDAALIADSLLAGKGRVMEAVLDRRSASPEPLRKAAELQAELDRLQLSGDPAATARIGQLRGEIRRLSPAAAEARGTKRWQDIAEWLREGAVFVDAVRFVPAAGDARYGAVVLSRDDPPRWIELGEERLMGRLDLLHRSLETRANILREGKGRAGIPMAPLLADLYRAFWQPVAEALPEGTREVIFCPDEKLHLLPFAVLRGPDGRFLCERILTWRTVDSGRGLANGAGPKADFSKPWLALGVADFSAHRSRLEKAETPWSASLAGLGDLPTVRRELGDLRGIAPAGSTILLDDAAGEAALREVASPAVLHLASHGFHAALGGGGDLSADPAVLYESGLLLAPGGDDDGILFPEEVGALDLRGTGLVTLSTCRGALGRPVAGEGVLGLRRAFAKAGARHVLASLWEIPDRSTAAFMAKYYGSLSSAGSPALLLWSVQAAEFGKLRDEDPSGAAVETAILSYGGFTVSAAE